MPVVLVVDANEQAHYATKHVDRAQFLGANMSHVDEAVVRPLTVADYDFVWRDPDTGAEHVLAKIERKTYPDLDASVMDTRYVSQAQRLVDTGVPRIYWAVVTQQLYTPEAMRRVRTAILHLSARPRTAVLRLRDDDFEFATELDTLLRYLLDEMRGVFVEAPLFSLAQERGEKVRLDTQPIVYEAQLAAVRGMSRAKARAVCALAPDMLALHRLWARRRREYEGEAVSSSGRKKKGKRTLDEYLDSTLEDVAVGGKRLGPALSALLRTTICPDVASLAALQ